MKINLQNIKIETQRLELRPVALVYAENIFKEFTEEITTFMFPSSPKEIRETEDYIKGALEKMQKEKNLHISIFDKCTGEFLGGGGIDDIDTKTPELGIWIKKSAHGKKIGREAVAGLKKWADENLFYEYLLYPVAKANIASRKIPESLGGKVAREFVGKKMNGETMEEVEYRIYAESK